MLTIAIPTYNRGAILQQTLARLRAFGVPILVVDQSDPPVPAVEGVTFLHLPRPSIPHAMNVALRAAQTPLVLFLDDDIEPTPSLVQAHLDAHREGVWAVVGQILQPGEAPRHHPKPADDLDFRFNHDEGTFVGNVMAGNLSVNREKALQIGGFDENFTGAAYRFESDFALRIVAAGGAIWFEPKAALHHLQLSSGGLRSYGDHRTSASPLHAVGDYYFALHHRKNFWRYAAIRLRKNVLTRFHARHPWTIPAKLIGELRGIKMAFALKKRGRRVMGAEF
jgi:GT2 family glycosyltransferase